MAHGKLDKLSSEGPLPSDQGAISAHQRLEDAGLPLIPSLKLSLLPPFAWEGDVCLALDSGHAFIVHRTLLKRHSSVLGSALSLAGDIVSVPCVSDVQAYLLLQVQAMYIYETETWYSSLAVHDLLDLARVSDCLDCSDIMKLCRKTLVAKCKVAADPVVVFDALEAASQLRMADLQQVCAQYLARNLEDLPTLGTSSLGCFLEAFRAEYEFTARCAAYPHKFWRAHP